jgi:PmbA protein
MTNTVKQNSQAISLAGIESGLLDVASFALENAKKQGATMAEVSIGQGQGMSVTVRKGEVETVEHNRDKSIGLTVYFGHRSGSASSTDFSEAAILSSVSSACNIARYTEEDEFNGLADADRMATEFPDLDLYHPWDVSMDEAIEIATQCEASALKSDQRISNSEGATVSSHDGSDLYANSHGFRGCSRGSRHSVSCSVIAGEGDGMQRDYWYDTQRRSEDLDSPEKIGEETGRRTVRRLDAGKVKTGEYPVIFEPSVSNSLISHLNSAISGSSLYRKASFLLDYQGKKIFRDDINIYEQPRLKRASGSSAFDGEGVATRENRIIEDGVLQQYLLSSYSARKLGLETTGNAGGVHNLCLDATIDGGLEEMIGSLKKGIVITELIGFGVNNVTGDYSRGAFGFFVENGNISHPVQEFTIAGNLKDIFQNISAVGSDINDKRNIRCGSILIDNITVAGE